MDLESSPGSGMRLLPCPGSSPSLSPADLHTALESWKQKLSTLPPDPAPDDHRSLQLRGMCNQLGFLSKCLHFLFSCLDCICLPGSTGRTPDQKQCTHKQNAILLFFFLRIIIFASAPAVPVFSEQIQDSRCCSHQDQSGNRHCRSCSENGSGS